jgi:hypothetical protein
MHFLCSWGYEFEGDLLRYDSNVLRGKYPMDLFSFVRFADRFFCWGPWNRTEGLRNNMVLIEVDYWKLTVIDGLNTATIRKFLKVDEFDFEIESKSSSN